MENFNLWITPAMLFGILFYLYHLQRDLKNDIAGIHKDIAGLHGEMGNLRDRISRIEGLLEGFFRNQPAHPEPAAPAAS